ncbi:hypothetical protein RQP46_004332 [Phenoliferia psychrophenolica]
MKDIIRDSTFGQLVNYFSNGRLLPFPDQRPDYVIPKRFLPITDATEPSRSGVVSPGSGGTLVDAEGVISPRDDIDVEKAELKKPPVENTPPPNPFLVDWEGDDDPDNPRNWSRNKRFFVASEIMLLTFSVYIGSAIYTSSIPGLMDAFDVNLAGATCGLTLFVLAYGIGPMFLSPLQEMPELGRNPAYIIGLFLFVVFQIPPIFAKNMATVLVSRFIAGFVGSPALATGGASMGDLFPPHQMPYAIGAWAIGAVLGPCTGPVIGGFAAQKNGWKWPFYELLWISGFALLVLFFFLPETLGSTVLVRRAERLRKLTGNKELKTQTELDEAVGSTLTSMAWHNFVMAFRLSAEPAIAFGNIYIALVYAVFYLWSGGFPCAPQQTVLTPLVLRFEAFPVVFQSMYGFNLGLTGLPFLGFVVSGAITFTGYALYNKLHMEPRYEKNPDLPPEARLELAVFASFFIPISLFMFGWGAGRTHWIVPIIGAALYLPGIFLIFQSILIYISMGFPRHVASIFAGNDLFRSTVASFFPLFGHAFYRRLGVGGGCSLLAGISILMIPVTYVMVKEGAKLRARSKWTDFNM